jgi:Zn-dependent peptidase ImmA (M78 family)
MLSPDGAEWWVVLNANDRYEVRRFTLAHEAFHIACGTGLAMRRDGMGQFYECSLADHFASHVLIPDGWLVTARSPTARTVARACRVSASAAAVRLVSRHPLSHGPW